MTGLVAVFRKEMAGYFTSPVAYWVIACFLVICGFFFWANISFMSMVSLQAMNNPMIAERINLTDVVVRPLLQNMGIVLLFVIPLLTMRVFSEEKKSGSIELLLTYPISDPAVVLGKYFASTLLLLIMLAATWPSMLLLFGIGEPDAGSMFTGYLGLFFMGAAFIALGIFVSSLTENQIISASLTFGSALLFWILSWTSTILGEPWGALTKQLSILEHLDSFYKGLISLPDVTFFALFTVFFLFLTLRSLETHRWRG
jgi:ABC-2 type transport system permease protein